MADGAADAGAAGDHLERSPHVAGGVLADPLLLRGFAHALYGVLDGANQVRSRTHDLIELIAVLIILQGSDQVAGGVDSAEGPAECLAAAAHRLGGSVVHVLIKFVNALGGARQGAAAA